MNRLLLLVALVAGLAACNGDDDTDTDVDTGSDTELDTEADTEPDTEADTEPDTEPDTDPDTSGGTATTYSGTLTYNETFEVTYEEADTDTDTDTDTALVLETSSCSSEFTISGSRFVGDCYDCDWAFELTSTEASGDCEEPSDRALLANAEDGNQLMYFWSTYVGLYASYQNVFGTGWTYVYSGYYGDVTYPLFTNLVSFDYAGTNYGAGSFTLDGTSLDWSLSATETDAEVEYAYNESACDEGPETTEPTAPGPNASATGDLPCDGGEVDVFSFEAEADASIVVTVDTVAAESAIDTAMTVIGPDNCAIDFVDDSFDCSFPPPNYQCSGTSFTAATAGTYYVIVDPYSTCAEGAERGSYTLSVEGGTNVTQVEDDFDNSIPLSTTTTSFTYDLSSTGSFDAAP